MIKTGLKKTGLMKLIGICADQGICDFYEKSGHKNRCKSMAQGGGVDMCHNAEALTYVIETVTDTEADPWWVEMFGPAEKAGQ